jgi:hypothetical protein
MLSTLGVQRATLSSDLLGNSATHAQAIRTSDTSTDVGG